MPTQPTPLVSVILPTYNRTHRLERAVQTVLEQTYEPIELVIVDDHSPRAAADVLRDHSFGGLERVEIIRHDRNRGANVARNNGIRAATGTYIAFLDDDDEWAPTKLERQVSAFQAADASVGAVYTGTRYLDGGQTAVVNRPDIHGEAMRAILAGRSPGEFSALMVRAGVVDEVGLLDERFPSWQDLDWALRLAEHCEFHSIPEPLTIRHVGESDRISSDYETKRDVSYPLFLEKHRSLARGYGRWYERRLISSLSRQLGLAALQQGHHGEARGHLWRAIKHNPRSTNAYLYLLATLGGGRSYDLGRRALSALRSLRRSIQ